MTGKKRETAGELLRRLESDPAYVKWRTEDDEKRQAQLAYFREAQAPITEELARAGIRVNSVWDLVNTSVPYPDALPILMNHLERGGYPSRVLEGLARALAVKPARPYWDRLRAVLEREKGHEHVEGLAVALAAIATKADVDGLVALAADESLGEWRGHFIPALARLGGDRREELLQRFADDPVVGREASYRLARIRKSSSRQRRSD